MARKGPWHLARFCGKCGEYVTWAQYHDSDGVCPICGVICSGMTLPVHKRARRKVFKPKSWWRIWRRREFEWEYK